MEFRFHETRQWKIDFAWPDYRLALEVEGAIWQKNKDGTVGGRHNLPPGFVGDMEKYNALACCGWRLIRVEPKKLIKAKTLDLIWAALKA